MSMIDCRVTVDRKPDPKGDRVVLTFECVVFWSISGITLWLTIFCIVVNSYLMLVGRSRAFLFSGTPNNIMMCNNPCRAHSFKGYHRNGSREATT